MKKRFNGLYLDIIIGRETVQLIEQLQHGSLNLSVSSLLSVKSLGTDGVQLVNEDDGWSLLLGESEGVSDKLDSVSNKHLDKLGSSELQEARLGLGSAGAGHQGVPAGPPRLINLEEK